MNRKRMTALLLALALALTSAFALADEAAPAKKQINVTNVDEFLAAIAPDTEIILAPGRYDLSKAGTYSRDCGEYYYWEEVYDGYGLIVYNCEGLTISGSEGTEIVIPCAYADVIRFVSCADVTVKGVTAGHTVEPGSCCGDVFEFSGCCTCRVEGCKLYGCGEIGVMLDSVDSIDIVDSDIYECSFAGVYALASAYVNVDSCRFYDLGKNVYSAYAVFSAFNTYGFSVTNCDVHDNVSGSIMHASFTECAYLGGCTFKDNTVEDSVFAFSDCTPVIENCSFDMSADRNWFYPQWADGDASFPVDRDGNTLDETALSEMNAAKAESGRFGSVPVPEAPEGTLLDDGRMEYRVSTVDELLASLGSNRVIVLEQELFTLSDAAGYGSLSGRNFYWRGNYDGPGLVIRGATGLTIRSECGASIIADPRYSEVVAFENCSSLVLDGLTLGHSIRADENSCSGGVIELNGCTGVEVNNCRLYGCGIMGVSAYNTMDVALTGTEIYECSQGAVQTFGTSWFTITGCNIHDCGTPTIYVDYESDSILYEGLRLNPGAFDLAA